MTRRPALMLHIVTGDARPITRQISDSITRLIASGDLLPGDALPSVRGLAQQLSINANTVAKAYAELSADGWLLARAGMGLFVAEQRQQLSNDERARRLDAAVDRFVSDVIGLDYPPSVVVERVADELSHFTKRKSA
ncbi:GntR family transcriptional regulator [Massilia sp. S19_KUP03_FR1]|uniref:GntR family transcriptional regulator n=1 Tax=Massilia sp. S19_KUP03_FR1 TaxID=3025503 RepID=UPI002FCD3227